MCLKNLLFEDSIKRLCEKHDLNEYCSNIRKLSKNQYTAFFNWFTKYNLKNDLELKSIILKHKPLISALESLNNVDSASFECKNSGIFSIHVVKKDLNIEE
ncbi:MAG: hypothetical protein GON13_00460 [Nanoarchaeota archaeon]|nr:hypothetical protein [Nanoarchaeota archaeon]